MQVVLNYESTTGLNKTQDASRLMVHKGGNAAVLSLCKAMNIDVDATGGISIKKGQTLLLAGNYSSMKGWDDICLLVHSGSLKRLYDDFTTLETLYSGISHRVSYCRIGKEIYFTDSVVIGKINNGTYEALPGVTMGFTKATLINHFQTTRMPTPAGQILEFYNNRLLVAHGDILYITDPMAYHRVHKKKGFIQMNGYISMVKAVQDGIFVSDKSGTYFLKGDTPKDLSKADKSPHKAIPYAVEDVDLKKMGVGKLGIQLPEGKYFVFAANDGIYLAGDGGFIKSLTDKKYPEITSNTGTILYRENVKEVFGQTKTINQIIFVGG